MRFKTMSPTAAVRFSSRCYKYMQFLPTAGRRCLERFHGRTLVTQDAGKSSHDLHISLCRKIQLSGPISVAQYMREVLTSPFGGYYLDRDMLGSEGDFITSPELNQMFGELIAIWFISEWKALGSPNSLRFIELGPGRGTLAADILRTFDQFKSIFQDAKISLHFVEVSSKLSEMQHKRLSVEPKFETIGEEIKCYKTGKTATGLPLYWHHSIDDIPDDQFTFCVAHEFFDALPVHKFIKTEDGWRELYVDLKNGSERDLELVVLPEITMASHNLVKSGESRTHVEVCPEGGMIAKNIAVRIENNGGACLIIDYGHTGEKEDTLRGFKSHKLNDIFENIGDADITADVDFCYIKQCIDADVNKTGPITQQTFLKSMGIEVRLMALLKSCEDFEQRKKMVESYKILMDEKQMGERFKFLAVTSRIRPRNSPVTGFYAQPACW